MPKKKMPGKGLIDEKTVGRVAELSRIRLSPKEVKEHQRELARILEYINKLNEADSSNIPPTSHPLEGLRNVFREDALRKSLTAERALQNSPRRNKNFFSVPKIIK